MAVGKMAGYWIRDSTWGDVLGNVVFLTLSLQVELCFHIPSVEYKPPLMTPMTLSFSLEVGFVVQMFNLPQIKQKKKKSKKKKKKEEEKPKTKEPKIQSQNPKRKHKKTHEKKEKKKKKKKHTKPKQNKTQQKRNPKGRQKEKKNTSHRSRQKSALPLNLEP